MEAAVRRLKKLRHKSLREVRERGRQQCAALGERLLGSSQGELSDDAFRRALVPEARERSVEATAAAVLARFRHAPKDSPIPSSSRRAETVALMESRFPAARRAVIERADRAVSGRFDLLGMRDLDFGSPIDWHLEPISGKRTSLDHWSTIAYLSPEVAGDKKVTWELNRHDHFVTLGQAYWLTSNERYADAYVSQASSWMDANPPGRGINWTSSLELAFRSISWLWAVHLFAESDRLRPEFVLRLLKNLVAHGRHVESYLSHYFSPNTHLTGEALGLLYLGLLVPELDRAEAWRAQALRILVEQLSAQVRDDGVYFEQATYYHRYTADFYTHLVVLARAHGVEIPRAVERVLAGLLDHLMWITRPDGTSPLVGDDDAGRLVSLANRAACDFRDTLATGAALLERGDWKYVAGEAPPETLWLLGPAGLERFDALRSEAPSASSRAFRDSGYFLMRDGWSRDGSSVLFDCGPHGALGGGHGHADALALEFASGGVTWLVDAGTFTYTADSEVRDEFRSTRAHNTATVDGQSQSVPAGAFSWARTARATATEFVVEPAFDYVDGSHDGYERLPDPVTHRRTVLFVKSDSASTTPSYIVVRDAFEADGRHEYAARFHFPADCSAVSTGDSVRVTKGHGYELAVAAFGTSPARIAVARGWVSAAYGVREPAPVAVVETSGEGSQELVTLLLPSHRPGTTYDVVPGERESRLGCVTIGSGDRLDVVGFGAGTWDVGVGRITSSGAAAWMRLSCGSPIEMALVGGTSVAMEEVAAFASRTKVRYCSIRLGVTGVDVRIDGSDRFRLVLARPAIAITVNGTLLTAPSEWRTAAFGDFGSGWEFAGDDGAEY